MESSIKTTQPDLSPCCKVLIVDDQTAVSGLLRQLIKDWPGLAAVGHCSSCEEALCFCAQNRPDLVIMDAALQGLSPPQFIRALKEVAPEVRLLVFSRWDHPDFSRTFVTAGVHGFVFKRDSLETLQKAVCTVAGGGMYFSPALEESRQGSRQPGKPGHGALTEREIAALRLIAEGHSTKEMAAVLGISVKTAEKYRERIMRKLDLHDAVQLTHFAIRQGLVAP